MGLGYSQQAKTYFSVIDGNEWFFTERVPLSYACYETFNRGTEGKGYFERVVACFEMLRS